MTRAFAIAALAFVVAGLAREAAGQLRIRGVVRSAAGEEITAAHVLVADSTRGTITNSNGEFELFVRELPVALEVRHLGYRTARLTVSTGFGGLLTVTLEPSVYSLDEIIVAERDFAENVMRKVILRKEDDASRNRTYLADGYTRITLTNDHDVVSIHEAVFSLWGSRTSKSRVVVRSIRQTSDIHQSLGFLPGGAPLANFYADTVSIRGLQFFTPTHPEALSVYRFSFARARTIDHKTVYDLFVAPRTDRFAAFIGTISVLAEDHVMIRAELRPARFVTFPGSTVSWDVFYSQQYFEADSVWVPADLHLEGSFVAREEGREYGPVGIDQTSLFASYTMDVPPPALLEDSDDPVVLDRGSIDRDYLFALGINQVPLTPRETAALLRLRDTPMTLDRAYPPRRPILSLRAFRPSFPLPDARQFDWPRIAGYRLSAGVNRADGYRTGIGTTWRLDPDVYLRWRLAQAFSLDRVRFYAGLEKIVSEHWWIAGHYGEDSAPATGARGYPAGLTAIATQLGAPDYYPYYWSQDAAASLGYRGRNGSIRLTARSERAEPLEARLNHAWPFTRDLGENPAVVAERMTSVEASVTLGRHSVPFRSGPRNGVTVRVEQSIDRSSASDAFTLLGLESDAYLPTFYRRRLQPNGLHIYLVAGTTLGDAPWQRYGTVQTSLRGYGTLGTLRSIRESSRFGSTYLALFWEHDFRGAPFEWVGLSSVAEAGVGLRITGAHARTDLGSAAPPGLATLTRFHHELGLSVTNPLRLPVRLDATVRLNDSRVFFGFGIGRF